MATPSKIRREALQQSSRSTTHLSLAIITMFGCGIAALLAPNFNLKDVLIVGLAYISLLFTAATLLIGPLYLRRHPRVPNNLNLRRDLGIWAGGTSIIHVALIFLSRDLGLSISYFLGQFTGFGLINWIGLFATLIMLALLFTSNDIALRRLRGSRWKALQRFNYLLFALAVIHTFGEEYFWRRGWGIVSVVIFVTLAIIAAQTIGFIVYRRRQRRKSATSSLETSIIQPAP